MGQKHYYTGKSILDYFLNLLHNKNVLRALKFKTNIINNIINILWTGHRSMTNRQTF